MLRETLSSDNRFLIRPGTLASREAVLLAHDAAYVDGFLDGTLAPAAMRRIGFPWSPELVTRTLASVGSTLCATGKALETGCAGTLAGGTHHAYRSEGSGFCVFNDLAIAVEMLRVHQAFTRFAIVDLDVHQGDGTAAIFAGDENVFTLSLHGATNFPFRKQQSRLDVALPDGIGDEHYLRELHHVLPQVWEFAPQIVFFQSGVDALASDKLGRLALSEAGLAERDRMVIDGTRSRGLPLVITLGGGYSVPIELTVNAHAQTFRTAASLT